MTHRQDVLNLIDEYLAHNGESEPINMSALAYFLEQRANDEDDADLFDDDFVSMRARTRKPLPKPLDELDDEEIAQLDNKHRAIRNRKRSTRRNLEGNASNKIRDHLFKVYGAVTTRVNSGSWVDEEGNTIRGAETGTSDILACVPIRIGPLTFGVYFAFEVKSIENKVDGTPAQREFIARVVANGGAGAVVRTVLDVDAAIDAQRQLMIIQLRGFVAQIQEAARLG